MIDHRSVPEGERLNRDRSGRGRITWCRVTWRLRVGRARALCDRAQRATGFTTVRDVFRKYARYCHRSGARCDIRDDDDDDDYLRRCGGCRELARVAGFVNSRHTRVIRE